MSKHRRLADEAMRVCHSLGHRMSDWMHYSKTVWRAICEDCSADVQVENQSAGVGLAITINCGERP